MNSPTLPGEVLEINECIICMDTGDSNTAVKCNRCRKTPILHQNCMIEYINKNINECPLCRYPNYPTENINNIPVMVEHINISGYTICGYPSSRTSSLVCNLTTAIAFIMLFIKFGL